MHIILELGRLEMELVGREILDLMNNLLSI
jgi:hypothetical protein